MGKKKRKRREKRKKKEMRETDRYETIEYARKNGDANQRSLNKNAKKY